MDYTTLALVKDEIHGQTTGRDALITRLVTAVSRRIDTFCTGKPQPDSEDYFLLEDVVDEMLFCDVLRYEKILLFPHKPSVTSVTSISWRCAPNLPWNAVAADHIEIRSPRVYAWVYNGAEWGIEEQVTVKVSYRGGLATDTATLPADLVQHATVWAARAFKEAATGLTDQIGMDELGILSYVKAIPATVADGLQPYKRVVRW